MRITKKEWTRDLVEEWLQIAALVDNSLPPVYHKGPTKQRIEIQRTLTELLWDVDEIAKKFPKWQPTNDQVSMWEEVILYWFPLVEDGTNRKILWLYSAGMGFKKIAKVVNFSRITVSKRYNKTVENHVIALNTLCSN